MPDCVEFWNVFRKDPELMLEFMPEPPDLVIWFAYILAMSEHEPAAALPVYKSLQTLNPKVNFDQVPPCYRRNASWMRVFALQEFEQTLARAKLSGVIPHFFIATNEVMFAQEMHDFDLFRLYFRDVYRLRKHHSAFVTLVQNSEFAPPHLAYHLEEIVATEAGREWFGGLNVHLQQLLAAKCLSPALLALCRLEHHKILTSVVERPLPEQVKWFHAVAPAPDFLPVIDVVNLTQAVHEFFISYMRAHIKVFATPGVREFALGAYDRPPRREEPYSILRTHAQHDAAKYMWVMAVGLADGYLCFGSNLNCLKNNTDAARFWRALLRLPIDIQQLLILRATGSRQDVIPATTILRGHWRSLVS